VLKLTGGIETPVKGGGGGGGILAIGPNDGINGLGGGGGGSADETGGASLDFSSALSSSFSALDLIPFSFTYLRISFKICSFEIRSSVVKAGQYIPFYATQFWIQVLPSLHQIWSPLFLVFPWFPQFPH
jgi:hypothetical protein